MFWIRLLDKLHGAWLGWRIGSEVGRHPVTRLPLRVVFERIQRTKLELRRGTGKAVLVMFDVNRLHDVNTVLGLAGGDVILWALANIVHSELRREDYSWQWGGDEILVLLDETDLTGAIKWVSRVEQRVKKLLQDRTSEGYREMSRTMAERLIAAGQKEKLGFIDYIFPMTGLAAGIAEWPREAGTFEAALAQAGEMLRAYKATLQIAR